MDIIAYQDEVGCVREPMPMQRMKENFKLLNTIHKEAGIRFGPILSPLHGKGDRIPETLHLFRLLFPDTYLNLLEYLKLELKL